MKIKKYMPVGFMSVICNGRKKFYRNIGFEIKAIDGDRIEFDLGETSFAILKRTGEKR
jgi:hypothetical protein